MNAIARQRRGLPRDVGPRAIIDGGRAGTAALPARTVEPAVTPPGFSWAAGLAAAARADADAARDAEVAALRREVDDLRAELLGARVRIEEIEAEADARVREVERRAERALLAERRRHVAGHTLPSILGGAE